MRVTDEGARITDIISAVKAAVLEANISATADRRDLRVSKVDLTLSVVATRGGGIGIDLKVPLIGMNLGGKYQHGSSSTQTVQVTLVPPPAGGAEVRGGEVEETLVNAIETVRAAIEAAGGGENPFVLESSVVTLVFAVTDTGSITLLGEGNLSDAQTSTLAVTFVPVAA